MKIKNPLFLLLIYSLSLTGCGSSSSGSKSDSDDKKPENQFELFVDLKTRYQTIDGFGAALPMWTYDMLSDTEVKTLVGTGENELGLTVLRTIINPTQDVWSLAVDNLLEAKSVSDEVKILATPWSPPAYMKDNNSTVGGGKLLPEYYDDYALHLKAYVDFMVSKGVNIDVVSVQNEPDWHPDYESCDWTGEEFKNFLIQSGDLIPTQVLVGESLGFNRAYTDPSLNSEEALANFEYVGGHLYGAENTNALSEYSLAEEKNKKRWMTEWLIHDADGDGDAIWGGDNKAVWDETLDKVVYQIHKTMSVNWNSYIWWWAKRYYSLIGDGQAQFGTQAGQVLKRGWAFSHFSKFIRPGAERIDVQNTISGAYVTGYKNTDNTVIVILNRGNTDKQDVDFEMPYVLSSIDAYVTSQTQNQESLTVNASGKIVKLPTLPARSIVTIVIDD
ncbi:hypothetical protein N7931_00315 [Catenovulum sp. 2E275]|uniref:glycoside hydrolase family 30 beta sandwich domain-containing protein n=1 Tax=Catenovulum sp. 2E275 TaxID=2980497 RepID=UPI0021D08018|nr:glycoside hydrolase family 30 beta sandwich domain-containing protein [Catenovulum sp. 2E275]MCU4674064.1 hypothetical protein [Catenovulum sp. 2E275]